VKELDRGGKGKGEGRQEKRGREGRKDRREKGQKRGVESAVPYFWKIMLATLSHRPHTDLIFVDPEVKVDGTM